MRKRHYLIGDQLFFGTWKRARTLQREMRREGLTADMRKIFNQRELRDLKGGE
tara:strand:+ start:1244 stop:1402 length:159 start_codon:yes stop_codon:yes gene_type:complete